MNLAGDVNGNKGFMKHRGDKRKTRENTGPWLSETGDLPTHTWKRLRY